MAYLQYASDTKKKISSNLRETGGGWIPHEITPPQEKIVGIIGSTSIEGISGGMDTYGEMGGACSTSPCTYNLHGKKWI